MMSSLTARRWIRLGFSALVFSATLSVTLSAAVAAERKMEARLIWGTNDEKSPDPSHKPLDGEIARKLREMPLKWNNFFEVNRKVFVINDQSYTNVSMSKKCSIEVKDKGGNNVTVKLYGQGKPVNRVDKPLPKGELLAIGGDDKNNSAWFITVRPVNGDTKAPEPKKENKLIGPPAQPAAAKPAVTK